MIIWKQGPFYPDLGKKVIELPNQIDPGPSDTLIKIDGFNVLPDVDGNFVVGSNGKPYTEDGTVILECRRLEGEFYK